jgi:hypothetical protein
MAETQAEQTNNGGQTTDQQTTTQQAQQTTDQQTADQKTADQKTDQQTADQQTADQKTADQKTDDQTKQGAPEKYEFKPMEGQEFDPEFIKVYSDVAKELDLPQDKAQALIDKISPVLEQRQMAKIEEVRNGWAEASKTDKEFGGDKLEANLGIAKAALDQFGTPELKELLNASGIGNHPEVIRYFYKVGKATSADTFVGGRQEGKGIPKTFNEQAARLYPNQ